MLESYMPSMDPRKPQVSQMHIASLYQAHYWPQLLICPLYARLTPAEQDKAFKSAPPSTRKVILATNVAETSITISGIRFVIDTGMAKEKTYHPSTGMDSLLLSPISKSSATQRAGRAGREDKGTCFRLYTELNYRELRKEVPPEIQRCSLAFALLHLMAAGQEDVGRFDYMDRPEDGASELAISGCHRSRADIRAAIESRSSHDRAVYAGCHRQKRWQNHKGGTEDGLTAT